jgi:hypothetical protein
MTNSPVKHRLVYLVVWLLSVPIGYAQMIRSDALEQDTVKLKLCIDRARDGQGNGLTIGEQDDLVPFEIDAGYVAMVRKQNPSVTFFAVPDRLLECMAGSGLYRPVLSSGESWFWHVIRPPSFQPPITTEAGLELAENTCLKDVPRHADLSGFDHALYSTAKDIGYLSPRVTAKPNRPTIGGVPVSSYDVEVYGTAFFKTSSEIDLLTLDFTCLYSPMLELKAVGWRKDTPGPRVWSKSARQVAAQSHH